jgi:hypothetical protein
MNLFQKLLEIQKSLTALVKDAENASDKYDYVSSLNVLGAIRPKMDELGLLLFFKVREAKLSEGQTKAGTTRYMTEEWFDCEWIDVDSGEKYVIPFYAQGVDLAGEKGVGKCLTYCEKVFLLKQFHIATPKDDPDGDGRTQTGEKKLKGTQAGAELAEYHAKAIAQMALWFAKGDAAKVGEVIKFYAKGGIEKVENIKPAALPVVYAQMAAEYKKRNNGAELKLKETEE